MTRPRTGILTYGPDLHSPTPLGAVFLALTLLALGCSGSDSPTTTDPAIPDGIVTLLVESPDTLVFDAGGRSPTPIRVRALIDGLPFSGGRLSFSIPVELGRLSQPEAQLDAEGWGETFVLDARPGAGVVSAQLGGERVTRPVRVLRAPGSVTLEPGSGAIGRPGFPHPDSIVRARVLDTEGEPLSGQSVLFAWNGAVVTGSDLTDDDGFAEGRLGVSPLAAGRNNVFALLPGRPGIVAFAPRRTEAVARRIVLVSIDGLRADAVGTSDLPTLNALAAAGASGTARSITPTFSVPAHLSMLAGAGPASHGIFSEDLEFTPEMNRLDPVFRVGLRRDRGTAAVVSTQGHLAPFTDLLECRLAFGFDQFTSVAGRAQAVIDTGVVRLADPLNQLIFLHLPDADLAGHASGWSSADYRQALREVDAALASLVAALPPDALLVVTSGHGGGGAFGDHQHGSGAAADREVPLVLSGPGIRPGSALNGPDLLDIAPTLVWALGWHPEASYEGQVLLEPFRPLG